MPQSIRYPRSQKFKASSKGTEAIRSYETAIADAPRGQGQAVFEAARTAWASQWGLKGDDALVLVEFGLSGRTISDAAEGLVNCGMDAKRVKAGLEHLISLGLLEANAVVPV